MSDPSRQPRSDKRFYVQFTWILVTVLVVVGVLFGYGITGLCHVAENRSVRFYRRCDSAIQYLPLTGLLVLVGGYVIAHLARMPWVRVMAILGAFVPLLITWRLLST